MLIRVCVLAFGKVLTAALTTVYYGQLLEQRSLFYCTQYRNTNI